MGLEHLWRMRLLHEWDTRTVLYEAAKHSSECARDIPAICAERWKIYD
jgi:hypothetical protein